MPKATKTVKVRPIPFEALRYEVESWSKPKEPHMVDLSEYQGNGACSCKDFVTRRQPAIRKGAPLFTQETCCRHILAAHRYWLRHSLGDLAAMLNKEKSPPHEPNREG